jgi:hypothetical protein
MFIYVRLDLFLYSYFCFNFITTKMNEGSINQQNILIQGKLIWKFCTHMCYYIQFMYIYIH